MKTSRNAWAGFTLIELLVVIAIIAILAGLLIPVLARAKDKARATVCQSNLRQLSMAAMMYDGDHGTYPIGWPLAEWLTAPTPPIWYRQLQPYVGKSQKVAGQGIFVCPGSLQRKDQKSGAALAAGGFWGVSGLRAERLHQQRQQDDGDAPGRGSGRDGALRRHGRVGCVPVSGRRQRGQRLLPAQRWKREECRDRSWRGQRGPSDKVPGEPRLCGRACGVAAGGSPAVVHTGA